jgi:hypothetical protein
MLAGADVPLRVTLTNVGTRSWPATGRAAVQVGYHWFREGGTAPVVWDTQRTNLATSVAPNASTTLTAIVRSPSASGRFDLQFDLVSAPSGWFSLAGSVMSRLTVAVGLPAARFFSASYSTPTVPRDLDANSVRTIDVTARNTGRASWLPGDIAFAYHWLRPDGTIAVWDGRRTPLTRVVPAGDTITQPILVTAPIDRGRYRLQLDLVSDARFGWFSSFAGAGPAADITVLPAAPRPSGYTGWPLWLLLALGIVAAGGIGTRLARRRTTPAL